MMTIKKTYYPGVFIFVFLLFLSGMHLYSQPLDSCTTLTTKKVMLLSTPWSESSNPAALSQFSCTRRIAAAWASSTLESGTYRRYRESESSASYGFSTEGFLPLSNWNFFGSFEYSGKQENSINHSLVMNPYDDHPYSLGDSIGGNYVKEYFSMSGKGTIQLLEMLTAGLDLQYVSGTGAKRKDPRPENTLTRFGISPGVIISLPKINLGVNLRYESRHEDIELSTVTGRDFDIFYYKGLGVYTSTTETDKWISASNQYGGGLQLNIKGTGLTNLTEFGFDLKTTDIKRGSSYPLQIAEIRNDVVRISTDFLFHRKTHLINRLMLFYEDKRVYGHEPVVEPKLEQVNYQWSQVAKYTLKWDLNRNAGFRYRHYQLNNDNRINWGTTVESMVQSGESTYYFIPEYNRQKTSQLWIASAVEKGISGKSSELLFSFTCRFRKNLTSQIEITEEESLRETVDLPFVLHDHAWLTAGLWQLNPAVTYGKQIILNKSAVQFFSNIGFTLNISDITGQKYRNMLEIKCGVNF